MGVKISVSGLSPSNTAERIINRDAKMFLASSVAKRMTRFWAMDSGLLSQTYDVHPDYVHYTQEYAIEMYKGKINGKTVHYSRDKHPLATAYPDKAMMRKDKQALADEMTDYFRRR